MSKGRITTGYSWDLRQTCGIKVSVLIVPSSTVNTIYKLRIHGPKQVGHLVQNRYTTLPEEYETLGGATLGALDYLEGMKR